MLGTPRTMKNIRVASLVSLLAFTLSASAVSVTINQDDATRLDFTVLWGEFPGPDSPDAVGVFGGSTIEEFSDEVAVVEMVFPSQRRVAFVELSEFKFGFVLGPGRVFTGGFVDLVLGPPPDFVHPAEGTPYGARFIYGSDLPAPPTGVPDGGNTLMLLAGALGTLGWLKRRVGRDRLHPVRL